MKKNPQAGPSRDSAQTVVPSASNDAAAMLKQALAFHQAGLLSEAETLYRKILQVQPRHFDALHLLGVAYHHRGEHEEAVRQIDLALKANPGFAAAHNNRGIALKALKRFDAALACYDKAIRLDHNFADAFNNRGVVFFEQRRFAEALTAFDQAVWLKPDYAEACNNRGNALRELKKFEDALKSYDRAIGLKRDFAVAYNNRGSVLKELGRLEEALASFSEAILLDPQDATALSNRGIALAESKRFNEALANYERALALGLNDAELFYSQGNAFAGLKLFAKAIESYDNALKLKPDYTAALNNRGFALVVLNRFDEALKDFDRAIDISPDDADVYFNKATVLKNAKQYAAALECFDRAIALKPGYAEAYNSQGVVLAELKRPEAAIKSYDRAIAIKPDSFEAFNNRGIAYRQLKRFDEAVADYERAFAINPDHAETFNNYGNVLKELKRLDEALACYNTAITLKPDYAEAFNNGGLTLNDLRMYNEALAAYDNAIALNPRFSDAHANRGVILNNLKRLDEALTSFDQAIAVKPDSAEAYYNRANSLCNLQRFEEAVADCERSLKFKPDQKYVQGLRLHAKMQICDWNDLDRDFSQLASAISGGWCASQPFNLLPTSAAPAIQRKCAEHFIADRLSPAPAPRWNGERYSHDRIRVAYVSGDLRDHPVGLLTAGLFAHHDKARFETVAISFGPQDWMSERLKGAFERFIDVRGKSDPQIAALLREQEVDIAVDLNGFTGEARPGIFAERPAPVQVNYLGYAGTLGCDFWDYIVGDRFVIPEACQGDFAEKVVYLPGSFLATDDKRKISQTPSRKNAGLPETGFVFCCFNNGYKFTPDVFDVWMRLLREVKDSVLWLSVSHQSAIQNLRTEAEKRGVSAERLIFAARVASNEDHLARLRLADLFLDTLYYNAHTTACDSLWAGLPIITNPGRNFASRVAGSLVSAMGMPELIASSLEAYEALALQLARDPQRMAAIKQKLAANRAIFPLFDTKRFTRHIEAAYTTMWERAQRGERPQSFAVA